MKAWLCCGVDESGYSSEQHEEVWRRRVQLFECHPLPEKIPGLLLQLGTLGESMSTVFTWWFDRISRYAVLSVVTAEPVDGIQLSVCLHICSCLWSHSSSVWIRPEFVQGSMNWLSINYPCADSAACFIWIPRQDIRLQCQLRPRCVYGLRA